MQNQRDILSEISGTIQFLSNDHIKVDPVQSRGQEYFKHLVIHLENIFESLESEIYHEFFDDSKTDEIHALIQSIKNEEDPALRDVEGETESNIESLKNSLKQGFTNRYFDIRKADFDNYKKKKIEEKIATAYSFLYKRFDTYGYYFRHLYHMLKYIEINEKDKKKRQGNSVDNKSKEYSLYAQFIQAQMSNDELLLTFYNSFVFPNAQKKIISYQLLENLTIQKLILEDHNCIEGMNLKNRDEILGYWV